MQGKARAVREKAASSGDVEKPPDFTQRRWWSPSDLGKRRPPWDGSKQSNTWRFDDVVMFDVMWTRFGFLSAVQSGLDPTGDRIVV